MKYNFVVSNCKEFWMKNEKNLFISDQYIYHHLEKNGGIDQYENIKVAEPIDITKRQVSDSARFIEEKYHYYISILSKRLNLIHKTNHDAFFWKKCMALGILWYITLVYRQFQIFDSYFKPDKHVCQILSSKSYQIPTDFDEHRLIFQQSDFGQEQLFSIYINTFYPKLFEPFNIEHRFEQRPPAVSNKPKFFKKIRKVNFKKKARSIIEKLLSYKSIKTGIFYCYFSEENLHKLIIKSRGQVRPISLRTDFDRLPISKEKRDIISSLDSNFDRFDQFFFTTLKSCFPQILLENFIEIYNSYDHHFKKFKSLKSVVCEGWIGYSYPSVATAILQKNNIEHIYNEHNTLLHHFASSNHYYLFPLVDKFITLGWEDKSRGNVVKGGSLFEWTYPKPIKKTIDILFVTSVPTAKLPFIDAGYGESGALNVKRYFKFNTQFFKALSESTKKRITYKGYFSHYTSQAIIYDQEYVFGKYLPQCKLPFDSSHMAKKIMQQSRLVVVNYLSTSYFEALIANIPLVFFWNQDTYSLKPEYHDFYDQLMSVGICQTDPIAAAKFVESIKDDSEKWWYTDEVQEARNKFLTTNYGNPKTMLNYLLSIQDN